MQKNKKNEIGFKLKNFETDIETEITKYEIFWVVQSLCGVYFDLIEYDEKNANEVFCILQKIKNKYNDINDFAGYEDFFNEL